jgi:tetratricopeptide (TPR) repeat protein
VFFGIWWFLLTLFPVYNLIEIFNPLADRYLYLPLVGFCAVLSLLLTDLIPRRLTFAPRKSKIVIRSLIIVLLVTYSTITIVRNRDWKDGFSLWSKTLQTTPNSAVAHGNLGRAYLDQGLLNEAINEFRAALQIRPRSFKAYYNLGLAYEKKGLFKEAILQYENSLNFKPDYSNAHFNLGNIYKHRGLLDKAIFAYKNVIEIDPEDIEARNNLGVIYAMQEKYDSAITAWENVLNIDPDNPSAADNIRKAKELINNQ